jgi:Fe-S cluster assembly iron-binding protein IscA
MGEMSSEATQLYTEIALLNESPVEKIRVTVTLKDGCSEFYYPLDYAKAARYFAEFVEKSSHLYEQACGPYKNLIDFGNGPKKTS